MRPRAEGVGFKADSPLFVFLEDGIFVGLSKFLTEGFEIYALPTYGSDSPFLMTFYCPY